MFLLDSIKMRGELNILLLANCESYIVRLTTFLMTMSGYLIKSERGKLRSEDSIGWFLIFKDPI